MDANDLYLDRYLTKQQEQANEYEEMLSELRDLDPLELDADSDIFMDIIEEYGYYSSDAQDILGDI